MDLSEIYIVDEVKEVKLPYTSKSGEKIEIVIKVKPMTWSRKNQILTKCFTYNQDGSIKFNFDRYTKDVLSEMIVEAPWGKTDEVFLNNIRPDFGSKLEKLVPKAFEELSNPNFFVKE